MLCSAGPDLGKSNALSTSLIPHSGSQFSDCIIQFKQRINANARLKAFPYSGAVAFDGGWLRHGEKKPNMFAENTTALFLIEIRYRKDRSLSE